MDAITIKAQKLTQKRKRAIATKKLFQERGLFYSDFSQKLYLEDMVAGGAHYLTIHDLIRDKVGGVQFTTVEENGVQVRKVLLRPQSSFRVPTYAIFELDGTIISDATAASIVPTNIAVIDVKRGLSAASIYGEAGNGGVITLLSKEPSDLKREIKTPGILTILHPGYHQARTFYIPDYAAAGVDKNKPDYRTTLYWNSTVQVEAKKASPFSFYTGDKLSEFLIFVEGITHEGQPIVGHKTISVAVNSN